MSDTTDPALQTRVGKGDFPKLVYEETREWEGVIVQVAINALSRHGTPVVALTFSDQKTRSAFAINLSAAQAQALDEMLGRAGFLLAVRAEG